MRSISVSSGIPVPAEMQTRLSLHAVADAATLLVASRCAVPGMNILIRQSKTGRANGSETAVDGSRAVVAQHRRGRGGPLVIHGGV